MTEIKPFPAIIYNYDNKICRPHKVVCPPYDIITPIESRFYRRLSRYNMIHLTLPKGSSGQNRYQRAASRFDDWENINLETWRAMTELYKMGRIRAIGVSNFLPHHLDALMQTEVQPVVNQIEFHPGHMQEETVQYCKQNRILVEAWSPLGTGEMLSNLFLAGIARNYRKSVAQLCIRWCLQNNTLPLPKSMTPSHIEENAAVFDFTISEEDMASINGMQYIGGLGLHPDQINF